MLYIFVFASLSAGFLFAILPLEALGMTILVAHGGSGDLELCVESKGYEDQCEDFNLSEWPNPFRYILEVDDPDEGHNFSICYKLKDTSVDACKNFEFSGSSPQIVNIEIPNAGSTPESFQNTDTDSNSNNNDDTSSSNNEDFSFGNSNLNSDDSDSSDDSSELPPLPPPTP